MRAVEAVAVAEVGGDRDAVAAASVRARERPAAQLAVGGHALRDHLLDLRGALPVLELAARRSRAVDSSSPESTCSQPRKMSLVACIRRCPVTTRWPWFENSLGPRNSSSTDASASLICRNSGSWPSRPSSSAIHARVPTLPTPTTLRAKSVNSNCSSSTRRSNSSDLTVAAQQLDAALRTSHRAPPRTRAARSARSAATRSTIRTFAVDASTSASRTPTCCPSCEPSRASSRFA